MRNSETKIKITRQAVEAASCDSGKPFAYIMDSEESGFGLRVTPAREQAIHNPFPAPSRTNQNKTASGKMDAALITTPIPFSY